MYSNKTEHPWLIGSVPVDGLEDIYDQYARQASIPVDIETFSLSPGMFLKALQRYTGRGKCCHENTLIPTNLGIITAKEIYTRFRQGEEILVLSEKGPQRVVGAINSGVLKGIRYYTSNGSNGIVGLDHKFRVINGRGFLQWKPAHQLKATDKVATMNIEHPAPAPSFLHTLETVDEYLTDLPYVEHVRDEVMRGDIRFKRCYIRRAFDLFELSRGPGISLSFDYDSAAWEFFMVITSVGVRAYINERTVIVLNGDVDNILYGCSGGSTYPYGPAYLNRFLERCNGDLVSITFVDETTAPMYDFSVEGSPTYSIGGLVTHNTML